MSRHKFCVAIRSTLYLTVPLRKLLMLDPMASGYSIVADHAHSMQCFVHSIIHLSWISAQPDPINGTPYIPNLTIINSARYHYTEKNAVIDGIGAIQHAHGAGRVL